MGDYIKTVIWLTECIAKIYDDEILHMFPKDKL